MSAVNIANAFLNECEAYNEYLMGKGLSIKAKIIDSTDSMFVLNVYVTLREPSSGYSIVPFFCFVFDNEIIFEFTMGKVEERKKDNAYRFICDLNASYRDYKFLYCERENKDDEINMRRYIDLEYIKTARDWASLAVSFANVWDLCRCEYSKGWEYFPM